VRAALVFVCRAGSGAGAHVTVLPCRGRVVGVVPTCALSTRPVENGVTWAASRTASRLGQVYGTKSSRPTSPPTTDVGRFLVPVAEACKCYR